MKHPQMTRKDVSVTHPDPSQPNQILSTISVADSTSKLSQFSEYEGGEIDKDNQSDIDNLDFNNFKGIYFDEDPNRKYQDPETGCHFEYYDLCKRMAKLK